ncbi:hypothetical protein ACA910_014695 [Epithemia clementina (nom. ined.)]
MATNQPLRVVLPPSCHDEMRQVWVSNLLLWHSTMASTSSTSSILSSSSITIKDGQEENSNNNATNKAAAVPSRSMTSNNPSLLEEVWKQQTRAWLKTTLLVQQQQQQQQQLLLHQQQQEPKDGRPTCQDAPNNPERDDETWVDKVVDQIAQEAHVIVESQLQQQQSLIMRISSKERSTMDATGAPVVVSDSTPTTKKSSSSSSFSLFSSGSLFAVGGLNSSSMFVWPVEQEKHADNPSQLLQSLQTKVRFLDDVVLTDDWTDIGSFLQHALMLTLNGRNKETANAVDAMTTTDPRPRPSVMAMAARDIHQDWYGKLRTMQPRQHYALALMDLCFNVFVAAAANSNSESNNNTTMDEKDHDDDDDDKKEWGDGLIQLWWTMWMDFWTIHSSSNPNNNSIGNNGEVQNKAWTMVQRLWPNNNNNQSYKNDSVLPDGVWKLDPTATWFRVWRMSQRRKKPLLSTTNHPTTTTTTTTTTIASTSNKDQNKSNQSEPDWDQWLLSHVCHELFSIPPPTTTGASIHFHTDKPPLNFTQRRLLILLTQWLIVHRSFQFPWNHALSSLPLLRTSAPEKNHNGMEVEKDDKNNTQFMLDRQGEVRVMFVERLLQLMVTTMAYSSSSSATTNTATTAAYAQDDVLMDKNNSIDDRQEAMESLCWQGLETLLAHAKQEQSQPNVTGRTTYARMQANLAKYGRPTSLAEGRERNAGVIRGMGAKESRCNNDSSSITIAILRQQIVSDHWPEDTSSDATT